LKLGVDDGRSSALRDREEAKSGLPGIGARKTIGCLPRHEKLCETARVVDVRSEAATGGLDEDDESVDAF